MSTLIINTKSGIVHSDECLTGAQSKNAAPWDQETGPAPMDFCLHCLPDGLESKPVESEVVKLAKHIASRRASGFAVKGKTKTNSVVCGMTTFPGTLEHNAKHLLRRDAAYLFEVEGSKMLVDLETLLDALDISGAYGKRSSKPKSGAAKPPVKKVYKPKFVKPRFVGPTLAVVRQPTAEEVW